MKDILHTDKVIMSYNPLTIEKEEKPLITLVSATRLNFRKGKGRMIELAKALDKANVNYIWYVFTNDEEGIESPNVIFLKNRLDVSRWIARADYLVQLSDTEACSYAINEMLYRNKPVIVTRLPYLEEIGFEDKKNGYVLNFDCSNIQEVVDNIYNIPKFTFKQLEDKYRDIFAPSKSTYVPEKDCGKDVIAINNFTLDNFDEIYNLVRANKYKNLKGHIYAGDRFSCGKELFDYLTGGNREGVKVVEEIS